MSYLNSTNIFLDGKLTKYGRKKISEGNFNIRYFQIGDSEIDYALNVDNYKVIQPLDNDNVIKYPYMLNDNTLTGITYGNPIMRSYTDIVTEEVGNAGCINNTYNILTPTQTVNYSNITNDHFTVSSVSGFSINDTVTFITQTSDIIINDVKSYTYKITNIIGNVIYVDRNIPNFLNILGPGSGLLINNDFKNINQYELTQTDISSQQDGWNLNVVWTEKPIGVNASPQFFESSVYCSTKDFFGYTTSTNQLTNTGTSITNSFGEKIIVTPEEQHSIAILHYSKTGDTNNPFKIIKYNEYLNPDNYFEIKIPFILYDRISGETGITLTMDYSNEYFINSSAIDSYPNKLKYYYLIDTLNNPVGKVFTDKKIIIIDDQEIVAALDKNSNRNYTLPIPKIDYVPADIKCATNGINSDPLLSGNTTGYTYYVTYMLTYTGDNNTYSLPCNYYSKITGLPYDSDISIKFNVDDFKYMSQIKSQFNTKYIADKFYILFQKVNNGSKPVSSNWIIMDFTNELLPLSVDGLINPDDLRGTKFIISGNDLVGREIIYDNIADLYEWPIQTTFGGDQILGGSVKTKRSCDIEVMNYLINLPSTEFLTTQNKTYSQPNNKKISEVHLLDSNFNSLVVSKFSKPIIRNNHQVISIKIDI